MDKRDWGGLLIFLSESVRMGEEGNGGIRQEGRKNVCGKVGPKCLQFSLNINDLNFAETLLSSHPKCCGAHGIVPGLSKVRACP